MRKKSLRISSLIAVVTIGVVLSSVTSGLSQQKGQPIVIGAPLSTQYLYGWGAQRAMLLAVEEINAKGGVQVGSARRPFRLEVLDTRDLEPGVPLSEVRDLLGHTSVVMTERYAHLAPENVRAAVQRLDALSRSGHAKERG